jgi:DMSO/TMAO reductase YedYZ molybdopterin-dependent catalytic subunit
VSVLECAGNGRSFYRPTVPGLQWENGGVGNGRWKGVRLGDILRKAGVKDSGKHVLMDGADAPIGAMPDFQRSLPVGKALAPETLLAYEMNGEPLSKSHGFPLRVVAPGWAGDSWVKWLTSLQVIAQDFDGFFMKTAYRYPNLTVAPGTTVDPNDMSPVEELRPKTVIAGPAEGARLTAESVRIYGAAWSGEAPVAKVEVSTDSGRSWRLATLGKDRAQFGWRLWEASWSPSKPGSYVLLARATDSAGRAQPLVADWNPSGYLWNAVAQRRVEVGPGPEPAVPAVEPPEFPGVVKSSCLGCHEGDVIAGQKLTRGQWEREVDKMVRWGATVKAEERGALIEFLASRFGIR